MPPFKRDMRAILHTGTVSVQESASPPAPFRKGQANVAGAAVHGANLMKNLTPEHMRCSPSVSSCPGVYELADRRLLIVGAQAYTVEVGEHEAAIIIDRALLAEALK